MKNQFVVGKIGKIGGKITKKRAPTCCDSSNFGT